MGTDESKKSKDFDIQRREYLRVVRPRLESFTVTLRLNTGSLTACKLMNISVGGAAVAVQRPAVLAWGPMIKEVIINFPDGQEVRCPAIVRHSFVEPDSYWDIYGIQFTDLSDTQKNIIEKSVRQMEA